MSTNARKTPERPCDTSSTLLHTDPDGGSADSVLTVDPRKSRYAHSRSHGSGSGFERALILMPFLIALYNLLVMQDWDTLLGLLQEPRWLIQILMLLFFTILGLRDIHALYATIFPFTIYICKCMTQSPSIPDIAYIEILLLFNEGVVRAGDYGLDMSNLHVDPFLNIDIDPPYLGHLHVTILSLVQSATKPALLTSELGIIATGITLLLATALSNEALEPYEVFLPVLSIGLIIATIPALPFVYSAMRITRTPPQHRTMRLIEQRLIYACAAYATIAVMVVGVIRPWVKRRLPGEDEPFIWILRYMFQDHGWDVRLGMATWWAVCVGMGIVVVVRLWSSQTGMHPVKLRNEEEEKEFSAALNRRRKFFHGLVVVMFIPTISRDPEFAHLAFSFALCLFILTEIIRACALPPFGAGLHAFLSNFTDDRDRRGGIVVSHLFLLTGCALPLWLTMANNYIPQVGIAELGGVLCLGLGDAMASIVGKEYGRVHWFGRKKTVEGTVAFVLAVLSGAYVAYCMEWLSPLVEVNWGSLTLATVSAALLEAFSWQNDNLVIPLYMWTMLHALGATGHA
ncbi:hypothetical protein G7K_4801-t1 [Saitoella complicata NRRL Y-17804]|uniref:dolichol kinase n=1 Tax=Saitoella complicata (strain BCRC 22490 / CBS 7301 / JCM 7358 / NBRC 10748 / NRRL Y-17804) TaxID=698492 RepID=A0A0E9NLF5_SAICN|nr:hypothetical protein G7K_4801-t1 [Saitoella complicata NRRL Y-17804]